MDSAAKRTGDERDAWSRSILDWRGGAAGGDRGPRVGPPVPLRRLPRSAIPPQGLLVRAGVCRLLRCLARADDQLRHERHPGGRQRDGDQAGRRSDRAGLYVRRLVHGAALPRCGPGSGGDRRQPDHRSRGYPASDHFPDKGDYAGPHARQPLRHGCHHGDRRRQRPRGSGRRLPGRRRKLPRAQAGSHRPHGRILAEHFQNDYRRRRRRGGHR